jgi:hypothetical protein
MTNSDGPPRVVLIAALVLAVAAVGIVVGIAATRRAPQQPVTIPAVPVPQADDPACRALLTGLPQRLGDYERAPTAQPAPAGTAAWRHDGDPVVLRCGVERPADFVVGSPIQVVDRVQWFQVADARPGGKAAGGTWYTVDRPVYVALTLPPGSGPTPIQQLSELIDHTMAGVPIRPAPPG